MRWLRGRGGSHVLGLFGGYRLCDAVVMWHISCLEFSGLWLLEEGRKTRKSGGEEHESMANFLVWSAHSTSVIWEYKGKWEISRWVRFEHAQIHTPYTHGAMKKAVCFGANCLNNWCLSSVSHSVKCSPIKSWFHFSPLLLLLPNLLYSSNFTPFS